MGGAGAVTRKITRLHGGVKREPYGQGGEGGEVRNIERSVGIKKRRDPDTAWQEEPFFNSSKDSRRR